MRGLFRDSLIPLILTAGLIVLASQWGWIAAYVSKVRDYEYIQRSGYLRVLTQNNPTTYYFDRDGNKAGFEYDLITSFADSVGLEVRFIIKRSAGSVFRGLARGEGDIAASGLSITGERASRFLFGPVYNRVSQQLVCRRGGARPKNLEQLQGQDLYVMAGSSYEERLKSLQNEYSGLEWTLTEGVSSEDLLKKVWQREIGCTIVDSNILAINQRYYPELKNRFTVGEIDSVAWAMPKGAQDLQAAVNDWYRSFIEQGGMASLQERYYGYVEIFDYVDTVAFIRRINSRYPRYSHYFKIAADQYHLSETLLASQAYQESHWNPRAISPTGVRGLMMLTLKTARSMGVDNRLDAEQSVLGGAQYMAKLRKTLSKTIIEPDLTWFALAAYNIGLGHVRDAQTLAGQMKLNPNKWHDLKKVLPLLSKRSHYKTLRYGYARGSEPVRYVQQIRQYEHTLIQQLKTISSAKRGSDQLEL